MRILHLLLLCPTLPALAVAQGVSAPWDISQTAKDLSAQAARLTPLLDQLTPEEWQAKGAPATYVEQRRNTRDEVGYLVGAADNLGKQPEKLTVALETYFRMQAVESQMASLIDGVRHYQNPAVGDLIVSVLAANSANRDQLRQYITDLAQTREQEFLIADKEAQRCRGVLTRQPAARPAAAPKPAAAPSSAPSSAPANAPSAPAPAAAPKANPAK
ncbi:MAG TPA: hypothetical protein VGR73_13905 [Bryobacteraceae bacterium]|nr:hypothetical protein [Bryobacteraceae bacterium]